jgi:hypothetical protein
LQQYAWVKSAPQVKKLEKCQYFLIPKE